MEAYVREREIEGSENRHFLEDLKIPEYLQDIIDEEQLKDTYVLWWLRHPGGGGSHAYWKEFIHDKEEEKRTGYVTYKKTFVTRVSLVWGIGYVEGFYAGKLESFEHDSGGRGYRYIGGGHLPHGYAFKALHVEGCAEEKLIIVHGATKIEYKPLGTIMAGGREYPPDIHKWNTIEWATFRRILKSRYAEVTHTQNEIILEGDQLKNTEVLQKTLASVYLDTLSWGGHFEVRGETHANSWPFDKQVSEQEQKSSAQRSHAVRIGI